MKFKQIICALIFASIFCNVTMPAGFSNLWSGDFWSSFFEKKAKKAVIKKAIKEIKKDTEKGLDGAQEKLAEKIDTLEPEEKVIAATGLAAGIWLLFFRAKKTTTNMIGRVLAVLGLVGGDKNYLSKKQDEATTELRGESKWFKFASDEMGKKQSKSDLEKKCGQLEAENAELKKAKAPAGAGEEVPA